VIWRPSWVGTRRTARGGKRSIRFRSRYALSGHKIMGYGLPTYDQGHRCRTRRSYTAKRSRSVVASSYRNFTARADVGKGLRGPSDPRPERGSSAARRFQSRALSRCRLPLRLTPSWYRTPLGIGWQQRRGPARRDGGAAKTRPDGGRGSDRGDAARALRAPTRP
jgi:hypothetical protein